MQIRTLKFSLRLLIALLLMAISATIISIFLYPIATLLSSTPAPVIERMADSRDDQESRLSIDQFAEVWNKRLRQPLQDAPPAVSTVPVAVIRVPLDAKLVGTIVEPGRSLAVFKTAKGELELKSVGEFLTTANGGNGPKAEVIEVSPNVVVLKYQGETISLNLPKEET